MSDELRRECQRCGERIEGGICNVHVVSMSHDESRDVMSHGSMWLCKECGEKLDGFLTMGEE